MKPGDIALAQLQQADDFSESGLKTSSLVRLGMIATIPTTAMLGTMGNISNDRLTRLKERLSKHIGSPNNIVKK